MFLEYVCSLLFAVNMRPYVDLYVQLESSAPLHEGFFLVDK